MNLVLNMNESIDIYNLILIQMYYKIMLNDHLLLNLILIHSNLFRFL